MQNIKISIHYRNLDKRIKGLKSWKIADEEKPFLVKFIKDAEIGKVNRSKRIGESRQLKYLELLKIPLTYWNKPFTKLVMKDVETFEHSLISNKIKSKKKTPFTPYTKSDIRKVLKIYSRWRLGETKALELFGWLDTRVPIRTPDYLSEQEVEKLYKNCKNNEERFLIALLFDSGARAEELHNIRFSDIQLPKQTENFVKLTLKAEYSKTSGRVISLFWKYSLEAVRDYMNDRIQEGIKNDDPVFKNKYDNSRQILYRLGKKVLNKPIHYHLFRHSSATFYATKLNRQELCYRFGWAFSSRMVDVYISRSGMENKQLDEKFETTELEDLKRQLEREKTERLMMNEQIKIMVKKGQEESKKIDEFFKVNEDSIRAYLLDILAKNKK